MIDVENLQRTVVKGLKEYLGCPVIRSNQNVEPPAYPYVSFTIITLASENKGTYSVYDDDIDRKSVTQTWSITAQAADNSESVNLAYKAREWLDHFGTVHLNDNDVIVQSVTSITNRDNVLTVGYEYKNGFDVTFWLMDEVAAPEYAGYIETVDFNGEHFVGGDSVDELNEQLEKRLTGR
jgi:hypothetical protein